MAVSLVDFKFLYIISYIPMLEELTSSLITDSELRNVARLHPIVRRIYHSSTYIVYRTPQDSYLRNRLLNVLL